MKVKWFSSSHPISDVRDWERTNRLEIQPDFQRKEVWSEAARMLLIDTILKNIPMPKLFLQATVRKSDTYRTVIDGQQRLSAILSFIKEDGYPLKAPYSGKLLGKTFSEFPKRIKDDFLSYKLDINEIRNASPEVIRDIYSRVNKYTIALTKQELRRADFPGAFLDLSEELAGLPFFDDAHIFTAANSKRMGDVEYVSELLALLLDGPQEKRESLDDFYMKYTKWDNKSQTDIKKRFLGVINDISAIWEPLTVDHEFALAKKYLEFSKTRYRQKADFYSLFSAIDECRVNKGVLDKNDHALLLEDLLFFDEWIEPEANVPLFSKYAIQCLSQSNTIGSRRWRKDFLLHSMKGAYFSKRHPAESAVLFHELLYDVSLIPDACEMYGCPPKAFECGLCGQMFDDCSPDHVFLTWHRNSTTHQLSNAVFVHYSCSEKARQNFIVWNHPYKLNRNEDKL